MSRRIKRLFTGAYLFVLGVPAFLFVRARLSPLQVPGRHPGRQHQVDHHLHVDPFLLAYQELQVHPVHPELPLHPGLEDPVHLWLPEVQFCLQNISTTVQATRNDHVKPRSSFLRALNRPFHWRRLVRPAVWDNNAINNVSCLTLPKTYHHAWHQSNPYKSLSKIASRPHSFVEGKTMRTQASAEADLICHSLMYKKFGPKF